MKLNVFVSPHCCNNLFQPASGNNKVGFGIRLKKKTKLKNVYDKLDLLLS